MLECFVKVWCIGLAGMYGMEQDGRLVVDRLHGKIVDESGEPMVV
jgi:hypothetical protein